MIESKYLKDNMQNIQRLLDIPALKHFEIKNLAKLLRLSKIKEYEDGEPDVNTWFYELRDWQRKRGYSNDELIKHVDAYIDGDDQFKQGNLDV